MQNATSLRLLVLVLFLFPAAAFAQDATVTTAAPIFLLPDASRVPLRTAAPNTRLRVLEETPDGWVKVEFRDPQFGMRIGFVEARHLKIRRPELDPMDLSVGKEPVLKPLDPDNVVRGQPPVSEPPSRARRFARGWVDVNFGVAMAGESSYRSIVEGELFRETATFTADYNSPPGAEFDFGGGFMFTPAFGLGVSFAGTAHQDTAQLGIRIPHPTFADAHASDSAPTEGELVRSEGSVNIQAMFVSALSDRLTARFFAGPSYYRIRQDAVSNIIYGHSFLLFSPVHEVDIRRYETSTIEFEDGGGWGFHAGGDLSFFFTRVVGLGVFGKYSRGTVEVLDPLSGEDVDVRTGGFQTGGGLRLRF